MKNKLFLILALSLAGILALQGQGISKNLFRLYDSLYLSTDNFIAEKDFVRLQQMPSLYMSETERSIALPSAVNNSTLSYMPPIFYQAALECGQASSICYNLSYELMRKRHQNANWGLAYYYPSHFAWNFCNGGISKGVSFMDTWEVIRTAGTPNVVEWGGWFSYGGPERWMSGYELYHSAMKNRISEMYAIHVDTEEGLLTLKHWLSDHLCGEATGGLANFYSTYIGTINNVLPEGTPEAGKKVLTAFTSNVNHAQTIVGYNDSIRWDYNGDGRYTNDVDINGDGVVNMKDWEIGGVIFCNSFGTQFADEGYCYLPYQKLASLPAEGGIWNKTVYVVKVKDEVEPQLTYKATINHNKRNMLKLTAGVASGADATEAEHILEFNVFNYQGGEMYMQGGNSEEANKTLELGLDISPLMNYIEPNTPTKFFFYVNENDPDGTGSGSIVSFSLMDYTSGTEVEQACPQAPVAIGNNMTTVLSVVRSIPFSKPSVQDSVLPAMEAFRPYSKQLQATGGKAPYRWEFSHDYTIEESAYSFPSGSMIPVTFSNPSNGYAIIPLAFDFPYYEDTYHQIVLYADGYISFYDDTYNWPFLQSSTLQFATTRAICPFYCNLVDCQAWKMSSSSEITLIVQAKVNGQNNSQVNYAVILHNDGRIEFSYGDMSYSSVRAVSSLQRGDAHTVQTTSVSGGDANTFQHHNFNFTPIYPPACLTLSEAGVLAGTSRSAFSNQVFKVDCYDNNDVKTTKELRLSSIYPSLLMITELSVNGAVNPTINSGDTLQFSAVVKNLDTLTYTNCSMYLTVPRRYVTLLDSVEPIGFISSGNEYHLNNCFSCIVSDDIPDRQVLNFSILLSNDIAPNTTQYSYEVQASSIEVAGYTIRDNGNRNLMLDANEVDTVIFVLENNSDRDYQNLNFSISIEEPGISVVYDSLHIDVFSPHSQCLYQTIVAVGPAFTEGHTFDVGVHICRNELCVVQPVSIIGLNTCQNFEDGVLPSSGISFSQYYPWEIDSSVSYTDSYSIRNTDIGHNDTCIYTMTVDILHEGYMSFMYKTSSENNYDWLNFFIDGERVGRWSGVHDWTEFTTALSAGTHLLTWTYSKDYSVHGNLDKVWVDHICMPDYYEDMPEVAISPEEIEVTLGHFNHTQTDTVVLLENISGIYALYDISIADNEGKRVAWVNAQPVNGSVNGGETREIALHFDSESYQPGDYQATVSLQFSDGTVQTVPVLLHIYDDTKVDDYDGALTMFVYPNPTAGIVHVQCGEGIEALRIYDMYGRLLRFESVDEGAGELQIDLSAFASGMYLLQAVGGRGNVAVKRIYKSN